jgi:ankyrin repeat protein
MSGRACVVSQGKYGNTPLHWAAVGGRVPCVEMLLKHGANKTVCNHNGRTPRDLAAAKGQTAVEHLLGDAYWSSDVRALHSSLERRVQEALDELRLGASACVLPPCPSPRPCSLSRVN